MRYNKNPTVLPEGYYLEHFKKFLYFLNNKCKNILTIDQEIYLQKISNLDKNSMMLFTRLINRSGNIFNTNKLSYTEIYDIKNTADFLKSVNLASDIEQKYFTDFLNSLTKVELITYLVNAFPTSRLKTIKTKSEILNIASDILKISHIYDIGDYLVIDREILNYFIFLFYGRYETTLSTQTLHDLGLRNKNKFTALQASRFKDSVDAQMTYELKKIRKNDLVDTPEKLNFDKIANIGRNPNLSSENKLDYDKLVLMILKSGKTNFKQDEIIELLSLGTGDEVYRKFLNELYKLDKNRAEKICKSSVSNPINLDHLLIADDFLKRKFKGEKQSEKTKQLLKAETLFIESKDSPEKAVKDYFVKKGFKAYRSENFLWTSLFGILFWDELFVNKNVVFHSEFDFTPESIKTNSFYLENKNSIENKLLNLADTEKTKMLVLQTVCQNYGIKNGIFKWHPSTAEIILNFLSACKDSKPEVILRNMALDFKNNSSGYPDIYYIKDDKVIFVEVKSAGDKISDKQFRQIKLLNQANFQAKVLRTIWKPKLDQTYVVIDVETTGGRSAKNRVTEIGAIKIKNGIEIDRFHTLINPLIAIPGNIIRLTGITNQMVSTAPRFSEIAERFRDFCEDAVFVAHNVNFDYSFIKSEFERAGINFRAEKLCTCSEMRKKKKGLTSYSLKNLSEHFNIELKNHHRALDDALAASKLLLIILDKKLDPYLLSDISK